MLNASSSAEPHRDHSGQRAGSSHKRWWWSVWCGFEGQNQTFSKQHLAVSKINIEANNKAAGNKFPNPWNANRFWSSTIDKSCTEPSHGHPASKRCEAALEAPGSVQICRFCLQQVEALTGSSQINVAPEDERCWKEHTWSCFLPKMKRKQWELNLI